MYIKAMDGNFFEVVKTEEYGSGFDLIVWKIRSTIYSGDFIYYDYIQSIAMVNDIDYEMSEEEYVNELAKWLLRNAESVEAKERFLKWGKAHGWTFIIHDGRAICGTNGKKMIMVSGGSKG